jgi:glycosyltransferase involved in cell wall biosynthesis
MTDRIKILFLLPTHVFGGAERTSQNLLKCIDKERFEICLVTSKTVFQNFQDIDITKFSPVEDLGINVWFTTLRRFLQDVKRVATLLRNEEPDIAFGMMHYPSSLLVFAKKIYRLQTKVVVSPRGPSIEYLRYFEKKFFRNRCLKGIFNFFCKYADRLIVSSQGMQEECIDHFHADPAKVSVIPNSVDFNDIMKKVEEKVDIDMREGTYLLTASGRLESEKNMSFLLRAFSEVRGRIQASLLIIGDGTERQHLERLSQGMKLDKDVVFVGYTSNPYKYIRISDLFVHTCLFEGFANSIIESMACGVPVIALDCPYGPRDIIRHEENGILVPMGNEGALADAIVRVLQDKTLRNALALKGLERAKDFSVDEMVKRYERVFSEV